MRRKFFKFLHDVRWAVCLAVLALAACSSAPTLPKPSEVPLSKDTLALLGKKGMSPTSPIYIRIFKEESELEVWKQRDDGRFYHFKTYPICNWSGSIGPKLKEGDMQAPEGFYTISRQRMNPNSQYYLAFNTGFPNSYDKTNNRTGKHLMVHGKCRSAGCYAMTNALMEEIYGLAREALNGGQSSFELHAFPFRMTNARMKEMRKHRWYGFWRTLKRGYDFFEKHRLPPNIVVCQRRYIVGVDRPNVDFEPTGYCPRLRRQNPPPFTPLPESHTIVIADGTKLKGIVDPSEDPTLADIRKAKSGVTAGPANALWPPATTTSNP